MPDSPLTRYATLAGVGWWDQPLSQDFVAKQGGATSLRLLAGLGAKAPQVRLSSEVQADASARGAVLEQVHRENPDWRPEDWQRFYDENADIFRPVSSDDQ